MELDKSSRKYEILCIAVDDYIRAAQPITSNSLKTKFANISTATLRNELNSLEAMGYMKQLHTSGGRVPTSQGYRAYVDYIFKTTKFEESKIRQVKHNYESTSINLLSTLTTFAKGLSQLTNCPTVLLQRGLENLSIINIQVVPLILKDALLLVETDCGVIDDSIPLSQDIDRASCIEASEYLTGQFRGKTIQYMFENINDACLRAGSQILQFRSLIDTVISALVKVTQKDVNISQDGMLRLYEQLTAEETGNMVGMNALLQDKNKMANLIEDNDGEGLTCKIGDETDELRGGMMMTTPIIINGVSIASLALLAPQRIDYAALAAAMKFITNKVQNIGETGEKNGKK